jgi:hypothetical protein
VADLVGAATVRFVNGLKSDAPNARAQSRLMLRFLTVGGSPHHRAVDRCARAYGLHIEPTRGKVSAGDNVSAWQLRLWWVSRRRWWE